jgi:hypothetical protein
LTVLVAQNHPLALSETLAVDSLLFVGHLAIDALKVAHVALPVTLFGLLLGAVQPALLVGVFSRLEGNALALEGAEDVVWAVVCVEVGLLNGEGCLLVGEIAVGSVEGFAGGADKSRLLAGGGVVGEDAIGDGPYAE